MSLHLCVLASGSSGNATLIWNGAEAVLSAYLAERKATRKREPDYERGTAEVALGGRPVEVAWAFPIE